MGCKAANFADRQIPAWTCRRSMLADVVTRTIRRGGSYLSDTFATPSPNDQREYPYDILEMEPHRVLERDG